MAITSMPSMPLQLCMSQVTMEATTEATAVMDVAFSHAYLLSSAVLHAVPYWTDHERRR